MSTVLILYIEFWLQYSWLNWLIMFALILFLFNLGITFAVSWKNWKQFSFFYSLEQFVFSETIWIFLQSRRPWFNSWVRNITWRRDRLPVPGFMDFPGGSDGKESACNVGDLGLIPGLGRSPGGGHGNPLRYSCLENPHGQKSLAGYSPWGHKELDTTEWLSATHSISDF